VARDQNAPAFRIFDVMPNHSVTIEGLTISNGLVSNSFGSGGGIHNSATIGSATLRIENSTISGNSAGDYGGGIGNFVSKPNPATLTINNSSLSGNYAEFAGGGIVSFSASQPASVVISNGTLGGNTCPLHGGGISNARAGSAPAVVEIGNTIPEKRHRRRKHR
jgi:hypothetical protein